jgi:hypothetical protein
MAKSDSFFIRAKATAVGTTFDQVEISLGSYVNLGVTKSTLLRIHNISVQYSDTDGVSTPIHTIAPLGGKIAWQLTTQSQSTLVTADDKSLVSAGALNLYGALDGSTARGAGSAENEDINVQTWTQGYLVGVDSIFLACLAGGTVSSGNVNVSVIVECTLENATQASALSLSLSQV